MTIEVNTILNANANEPILPYPSSAIKKKSSKTKKRINNSDFY
eukprot:CAMPEP_0204618392 /NCGR_PEP_ID=MMETSP0717-20131115/5049_1 /ASSEMBLY_ACC=CAM_ASM_000666 /TAXON_ID=230516 /ORGANISM="Chaetoceros curvisetus" /LENGTH=42 /DNA_ID= /DNA_START= /DNA_END= /DNA_ORIENTATION=